MEKITNNLITLAKQVAESHKDLDKFYLIQYYNGEDFHVNTDNFEHGKIIVSKAHVLDYVDFFGIRVRFNWDSIEIPLSMFSEEIIEDVFKKVYKIFQQKKLLWKEAI